MYFICFFSDWQNLTSLNYDKLFAYGCLNKIPFREITLNSTFIEQEKTVLMEIFNGTNGHNWRNNKHWGNYSVSHCLWYGITCDPRTNRSVISIFLERNNLIGTLPRSLWRLRNLQGLCLGRNGELQGEISEIVSENMTNLLRLGLAYNKLSGRIPSETLVRMKSLVVIQLSSQIGEGLTGEIPQDIGNLTDLQILSLEGNRLNGSIPKSIVKLKKLWFLDLKLTRYLKGGFRNLFNLSSLRFMQLSYSGLNGTLPEKFGTYFPGLIECRLVGNHFSGKIPSSIGEMKNLWHLHLANNNFSGQIPKQVGEIAGLQTAHFEGNNFASFQSGFQFTSKSLEDLSLANNKHFNMSVSDLLKVLEPAKMSLRFLNISGCSFDGLIPAQLWEFLKLFTVDFSNNRLSGEIPTHSAEMISLRIFDVSKNNLSGEIPRHVTMIFNLIILDVSNNSLMQEIKTQDFMEPDFTTLTRRNSLDNFTCPNLRISYSNGLVVLDPSYYNYSLCVCDNKFYGSGRNCLSCMEGGNCSAQRPPLKSSRQHIMVSHMVMDAGYWPSPGHNNVTHLVRCSEKVGASRYVDTSCNTKGTCKCEWREAIKSTICNESCLCSVGSKGRFCSLCEESYYKKGIRCYPCADSGNISIYILAALAVFTMVLLTLCFTFFYQKNRPLAVMLAFAQIILLAVLTELHPHIIPSWMLYLDVLGLIVGLAGRGKAARGIIKITVFYLQTLDALISNTDVWPIEIIQTKNYIVGVFNLRFTNLACEIPSFFTPLGELLFLMLLPVILIVAMWLCYGLGYAVLSFRHSLDKRFKLRNNCLQFSIMFLSLCYFPIVEKTASVLAPCGTDENYHYLMEAPWMECRGSKYNLLKGFGWFSLAIYVLGVPFVVFLPLLRYKAAKRDQLPPQDQKTLDTWLGSIYLPYKNEFRSYFEILFILRSMLIGFSVSFISPSSSFRTIAVCFVLLVSLCFQLLFKPFKDSCQKIALENSAETLVLLTLHFSFVNIRYVVLSPDTSIVWLLVVVNAIVFCGLIISIITLLLRRENEVYIPIEAPLSQQEVEEDEEWAPEQQTEDSKTTSPLIGNEPVEVYGTFDN